MRTIFWSISLVSAFTFGASEAYAQCDCACGSRENDYRGTCRTALEELQRSEVVFIGEVVEEREVKLPPDYKGAEPYMYAVRFKVERAWKKKTGRFITIKNGERGCLFRLKEGEKYLVYAVVYKKVLRTWYCSRTRLLAKAPADLKAFEENGKKPLETLEASPKP